ncbi:MAG: type II CRISPR RNA-guided endonuclease Cas9 [Gammaproteobacteria bacterium]
MAGEKILGLDLGSNSVGWALLEEQDGRARTIIAAGSRIFNKAVGDKTPTPKNQERRERRLARRVLQRRARRKQRMTNYLVSLDLLPKELRGNAQPEALLNGLGDPYALRAKGLDAQLSPHEFGRILLHFAARRGFLSAKKQAAGDLVDDPDTIAYLEEMDDAPGRDGGDAREKEETAFKESIKQLRNAILRSNARTLGEYLYKLGPQACKRNRKHDGGFRRTERAMYQQELAQLWQTQAPYFAHLPADFMADKKGVQAIIFYQRPLKLKKDRVGKCSLEPKNFRASMARPEAQRYRYLLDVNNLQYAAAISERKLPLDEAQREKLTAYFEHHRTITAAKLKSELGLDKRGEINLEAKNLKGNITACQIRGVIGAHWDDMTGGARLRLFEDLFSIKQKSALKTRLMGHWKFDAQTAVQLCLLEFEQGHLNHSLKAVNKLLPHLEKGMSYAEARAKAGYGYEKKEIIAQDKLGRPPETSNPIVNRGLHELRRVVNAVITVYGKPDVIRIEMARELEENTERVKAFIARQKENEKANKKAQQAFSEETGKTYASRNDKIKYRLWEEQQHRCIYSGDPIASAQLFSDDTEIDHIVPRSRCLDDSYTNKVVCFVAENRHKGKRTPAEAWGDEREKWHQITRRADEFYKDSRGKYGKRSTHPKKRQCLMRQEDIAEKYGMSSAQLNDTRYISTLAEKYVRQLGCDVSVTKGAIVAEARYWWGVNSLLGETDKKERDDHRHHAIDAAVIACINRGFHQQAVRSIQASENAGQRISLPPPYPAFRDELGQKIENIIVSHAPQRKLSGGLHEETGAGYIERHGGLVYRKAIGEVINKAIKQAIKRASRDSKPVVAKVKIVDKTIKKIVCAHVEEYAKRKEAFPPGETVIHKDGKTPVKRVRVLQSATTEEDLAQNKFGVRDKSGKPFKWVAYGNTHHVEVLREKKTGEIKGEFVTMMRAAQRVKGIGMPKQPMVKIDHGEDHEFLMALHINDTVSVANESNERVFYRVQNLESDNRITLRLSTASTLDKKEEGIRMRINRKNFAKRKIRLHRVSAIGLLLDDD